MNELADSGEEIAKLRQAVAQLGALQAATMRMIARLQAEVQAGAVLSSLVRAGFEGTELEATLHESHGTRTFRASTISF